MKNYRAVSAAVAVLAVFLTPLFLLPSLEVQDKQAPGTPGDKTFQLLIDGSWYVVPETVWNNCALTEKLPACAVSEAN